jgi:sterol desaturase/sphingolipid hydroxylase (fatty acid hydroxylase superfamily)
MFKYTHDVLEAAEGRWPASPDHTQARRPDQPKSIRVFENPFLEAISKSHWSTPGIWFGPFVVWALVAWPGRIGLGATLGYFGLGWLLFSLFEYSLHRIVFHGFIRIAHDQPSRFRAFMTHGYHHEFPDDPLRLVMPPMISWPLAVLFAAAYYGVFGAASFFPVLAGTMAGYVAYDWIHYYTHHGRPRGGVGKWLRAYHMRHHYQDPDAYMGISSPLWDLVFGTYRSPLGKKSATLAPADRRAA